MSTHTFFPSLVNAIRAFIRPLLYSLFVIKAAKTTLVTAILVSDRLIAVVTVIVVLHADLKLFEYNSTPVAALNAYTLPSLFAELRIPTTNPSFAKSANCARLLVV